MNLSNGVSLFNPWGDTFYMAEISYACNHGYMLTGKDTVTCKADGQWSKLRATCTLIGMCLLLVIVQGNEPNVFYYVFIA